MDRIERWYAMPIGTQISNVGSEVHRAIRWKNKNDADKAANFCDKAIELLELTKSDPKNHSRIAELDNGILELQDYFEGENLFGTTDNVLIRFYDSFL